MHRKPLLAALAVAAATAGIGSTAAAEPANGTAMAQRATMVAAQEWQGTELCDFFSTSAASEQFGVSFAERVEGFDKPGAIGAGLHAACYAQSDAVSGTLSAIQAGTVDPTFHFYWSNATDTSKGTYIAGYRSDATDEWAAHVFDSSIPGAFDLDVVVDADEVIMESTFVGLNEQPTEDQVVAIAEQMQQISK